MNTFRVSYPRDKFEATARYIANNNPVGVSETDVAQSLRRSIDSLINEIKTGVKSGNTELVGIYTGTLGYTITVVDVIQDRGERVYILEFTVTPTFIDFSKDYQYIEHVIEY